MELSKKLISTKAREVSGSRVDERYNYQKDLSLYTMIEKYYSEDDYVFLFDFHDDLVMLNSDCNPTIVRFYQIKTKANGNWTQAGLTSPEKKDGMSYLSKLYINKVNFSDYSVELNFISNARFSLKLKNQENSINKFEIPASNLLDSTIREINNKIKKESELNFDPTFEANTTFMVSKLSLSDSKTHCKGLLSEVVDHIRPNHSVNINLIYDKLFNEIRIKTDRVIDDYNVIRFDLLILMKGISKKEFTKLLIASCDYKSSEREWDEIEHKLINCGVGHIPIRTIKYNFRELNVLSLKSPNDDLLIKLLDHIKNQINEICTRGNSNLNSLNFYELYMFVYDKVKGDLPTSYLSNEIIQAIIIKQLNDD